MSTTTPINMYKALSKGTKGATWIKELTEELSYPMKPTSQFYQKQGRKETQ